MAHIVPSRGVTGPSRHLVSNVSYTSKKPLRSELEAAFDWRERLRLLDLVRPFAFRALGRFEFLPSLCPRNWRHEGLFMERTIRRVVPVVVEIAVPGLLLSRPR